MTHELEDVIGMLDIARLAGVSTPAANNWKARHADFPKPIHHVSNGTPLYSQLEVIEWLTTHGKQVNL